MSRTLHKAIMKRSKLRNTLNKKRSSKNWQNYKWQRNICLNILKSTDNRKFWKTVELLLTDKCKT